MPKPKTHRGTGFARGSVIASRSFADLPKSKRGALKDITTANVACGECKAEPGDPCRIIGYLSDGVVKPMPQAKGKIGDPMKTFHRSRYRMAQRARNQLR